MTYFNKIWDYRFCMFVIQRSYFVTIFRLIIGTALNYSTRRRSVYAQIRFQFSELLSKENVFLRFFYKNAKRIAQDFYNCCSLVPLLSLRSVVGGLKADKKFWQLLSNFWRFQGNSLNRINIWARICKFMLKKWVKKLNFERDMVCGNISA